jgi:hypothetical protein
MGELSRVDLSSLISAPDVVPRGDVGREVESAVTSTTMDAVGIAP